MKLLVFAHTPPPHHGQSYMVQLMLAGFGGDLRRRVGQAARDASATPFGIECYHVNARLSQTLEDIGDLRLGKFILLMGNRLQAIWCRYRYGVDNFYYVPAPGKRVALYRDWLVMFVCRPFFKRIILHWHAAGMAKWLETSVRIRTRAVTYHAFKRPALSIVISNYNVADAEKLLSQRICRVNYGIPDPCRDFEKTVLPRRQARFAARAALMRNEAVSPGDLERAGGDPQIVKVSYFAHYMREKGSVCRRAGGGSRQPHPNQPEMPYPNEAAGRRHFRERRGKGRVRRVAKEPRIRRSSDLPGICLRLGEGKGLARG